MTVVLGLDPSEKRVGLVVYDTGLRVALASAVLPLEDALRIVRAGQVGAEDPVRMRGDLLSARWSVVVVERFRSQGKINSDIIRGIEASGMLFEAARAGIVEGGSVDWLFRLDVCRELHVSGKGKDSQIIDRCCEMHGGSRSVARGLKKSPGPLYGVSGDAWQALGAVLAWSGAG